MSTEAETTSAAGTVATPSKVATPVKESPVKEGGSAPTTPSKETDEARIQLTQGRRHLLVKDYFSAVTALAKGCELLAQKFGDTAPELGDAYLTYGRALLELARSENGVLGMNEEGETAAEDDEEEGEEGEGEDEGVEDEEKDGAEAKENGEATAADTKENGKDAETKANGAEAKEDGKEVKANGAEANGTDSEATNGKESDGAADPDQTLKEDEEEDDVNNLQLSWEVLELAKGIFQKQIEEEKESKQTCLKLAEVHLKLGEVGVESESYITAVEDMKACLELQKKYLDEDDRRIAETLYHMGMAYSLANEFDAAIEHFKSASVQIEKRIENLEKKSDPAPEEKSATDDPFYSVQSEIDELKALLPEIKDKICDMQDFKKEVVRRMMDGLAEASAKQSSTADGAGPSTATASASDKPVSSVAHLVKRKPKEEVKEESPAADKTEKMDTSPAKSTEEKTEKVESSSSESSEQKSGKVESVPAESSEEKKADEEVSDRKRKPEDSVEVEDPMKKAKVEESAESKLSE